MSDRLHRYLLAGLLLLAVGTTGSAALEVPFLAGRVNDLADILSAESESRITSRLRALEEAEGAQIAVLTLPSLEGESLEDYSLRVAETWKLGRADADDGALLLIARDDRKMRFEVGYGLEPILTDAYSRRILDNVMRPRFRAGDFDGGVESAIDAAASLIEGNDILPPPSTSNTSGTERPGCSLIFLVIALPFVLALVRAPGCGAWIFYIILMPFIHGIAGAMFGPPAGVVGVAIWAVLFPVLRFVLGKFGGGSGPTIFGSTGGWSSSGGGFSSGGFSGGGGSFGGGGSSSGW